MQNILDKLDLKKEKRLFREILKVHGLLKCKREEEYISALQYILDRGVSYKINDYVFSDFKITNYKHYDTIKMDMRA